MDQRSLTEYARDRGLSLVRFAYALTGDRHLAEDLTQSAFEKVAGRWHSLDPSGNVDGYLRTTITRTYLDWRRRRAFSERVAAPFAPVFLHQPAQASRLDDDDPRDLWGLLSRLPPRQRCALVLRYYEDLDDNEIAEVMGCSASTVRSNAARGLSSLCAMLAANDRSLPVEGARWTSKRD